MNIKKKTAKLKISYDFKEHLIPIDSILYIQSSKRVCEIITDDKIYRCYKKLSDFPKDLPEYFARCHQSYIVNAKYIVSYQSGQFTLTTGAIIPISDSYAKDAKKFISYEFRRINNVTCFCNYIRLNYNCYFYSVSTATAYFKKDKPIYKIIIGMFFVFTMVISFLSRINEEFNANPFKPIILFGVIAITFFTCFSDKISQKTIAYVLFLASMCITELSVMVLFTFMGFSLRDDKVANVLSNVVAILVLWILLLICKKNF